MHYDTKFYILSFKRNSVVNTDVEKKTIKQLCEFTLFFGRQYGGKLKILKLTKSCSAT